MSEDNFIKSCLPKEANIVTLNPKEIAEKLNKLIKITMSEELSRKQIVDKMEDLKKKRRVINFLKGQFGS